MHILQLIKSSVCISWVFFCQCIRISLFLTAQHKQRNNDSILFFVVEYFRSRMRSLFYSAQKMRTAEEIAKRMKYEKKTICNSTKITQKLYAMSITKLSIPQKKNNQFLDLLDVHDKLRCFPTFLLTYLKMQGISTPHMILRLLFRTYTNYLCTTKLQNGWKCGVKLLL